MKDLFYYPDLSEGLAHSEVLLPNEEAQHLLVRRYQMGDTINLFNDANNHTDNSLGNSLGDVLANSSANTQPHLCAAATIVSLDKRKTTVLIGNLVTIDAPKKQLVIASALPKNDRIHTMLDMCAQSGMSTFIPLLCMRSVTKLKKQDNKIARLHKYMVESCKQSGRPIVPRLQPQATIADILNNKQDNTLYLYADANGKYPAQMQELLTSHQKIVVLLGPEGGFDDNEMKLLQAQASPLALSDAILRTETASVLATAMIRAVF